MEISKKQIIQDLTCWMWRFSNDAVITPYEFLQPQLPPDPQSVRPVFTRNCVASNGLHFCGDDLYLERRLDGLVIDLHGHIYDQHDLSNPLSTFSIEGDGHMVAASIANYGFEKKHKAFIPVPDFISDESDTFFDASTIWQFNLEGQKLDHRTGLWLSSEWKRSFYFMR